MSDFLQGKKSETGLAAQADRAARNDRRSGAYDALTARIIEQAGFPAVYMTGFGTAASLLGTARRGPADHVGDG